MMPVDDKTNDDTLAQSEHEDELRRKALKRSWLCPGAGFALVGNRRFAIATFATSICTLPAVAWLALQPTAASLWTTIAAVAISSALWAAEQIRVKKAVVHSPSPSILDRAFMAAAGAMWLAVALAFVLLITSFGSLRMAGSGMQPTLEPAELLVYHKQVDWRAVKPGAIIVYKNPDDSGWGQPGWLIISRILAGPGDKISIRNGKYLVNGAAGPPVAETGNYHPVLEIPHSPESRTIPDDCYFMVQESPRGGLDSRVLSWARADKIVGSRLWYLSRRGVCTPVK